MSDNNESTIPNMGKKVDAAQEDGVEHPTKTAKNNQQPGSFPPEKLLDPTKTPRRKSTGPRTMLGKQRSSRNALKHGFCSRKLLLKSESSEFRYLVSALREAFPPVGAFEELLIEDLAMCWIHRKRCLQAEHAEIALARDFIEIDLAIKQQKQLYEIQEAGFLRTGQLSACSNPFVISVCIALLEKIRLDISCHTFDPKKDFLTLNFIYGMSWTVDPSIAFLIACKWLIEETDAVKLKQRQEANADYEGARSLSIESITVEIERLRSMKEMYAMAQRRRLEYIKQAAAVPNSAALERLLRYSAFWSREFERKLNLIEHVQRMRKGQPVPPTVRLELPS